MRCDVAFVGTETKVIVDKLNLLVGIEVEDFTASKFCEIHVCSGSFKETCPQKKRDESMSHEAFSSSDTSPGLMEVIDVMERWHLIA